METKKQITLFIPPAAVALRPKIVIELSEVVKEYLNKYNLSHRQDKPGEFIIHSDQKTITTRINDLEIELAGLKNHDKLFEGEIAGLGESGDLGILQEKIKELESELADTQKLQDKHEREMNEADDQIEAAHKSAIEKAEKDTKELIENKKLLEEEIETLGAELKLVKDNKPLEKEIAALKKQLEEAGKKSGAGKAEKK